MTELIWDGKYDQAGKKVAPPRIILPFQTVETVNESAADRDRNLSLFGGGPSSEWRNRLIWGDKRHILPSLLPELAGKVNLIYIDPPFDTGANFSYLATIPDAPRSAGRRVGGVNPLTPGDGDDNSEADADASAPITGGAGLSFVKEPSVIEQKAYRDTWGKGLDSYLKWFHETVVLLRELLADDGNIFVHLDWHVSHYCKPVLDEVFGIDNFLGEITWNYGSPSGGRVSGAKLVKAHDTIFQYAKRRGSHKYKLIYLPYSEKYISDWFKWTDEDGRRYRRRMRGRKSDGDTSWEKQYLDESKGMPASSVWNDIQQVYADPRAYKENSTSEILDYPTQKPERLVTRVLEMSTEPGDLILDCFCGSGTTAAVAEKLGRRWITCDLGRFAIHTARKRLLAIPNVTPFVVQNLGKYERQAWQTAEFGEKADAIAHNYRQFILSLYRAQTLNGYVWLHGVKAGRMVHVGDVGAPISTGDVAQAAAEFKRLTGSGPGAPTEAGIDILGWDFAFEINEVAKQQAALAGIAVRFVRIPREVLEKKAVEQGDIKFFELAALNVQHQVTGRTVRLELTDFVIPLDDVPQEIQAAITHWEQWVDYWAVDWDNHGDTFHNQWQDYRTRAKRTLQRVITSPPGAYAAPGEYKIVVKVIDILGNDTTKTLRVQVK